MKKFQGKNSEDIQKMNRVLIIKLLQHADVISRSELATMSNLKQATITNIINNFIQWGLVEETGLIAGSKGRRSIGLRLCKEKYKIISLRFSRKHVQIMVFDMGGSIYSEKRYKVDAKEELRKAIFKMIENIKEILEELDGQKVLGIGIAMPGPWMKKKKTIAYFTGFYEWKDVNIAEIIEEELNIPVFLEQDANAALLAEYNRITRMNDENTILCIMVGQGIGAGIITKGELLKGKLGIAGEIGHMSIRFDGNRCECGNVGCLEGYSSTISVINQVRERIKEYPNSVLSEESNINDILEAYKHADPLAVEVVNGSAKYIGYALASLTNVINPGIIIIGDEMSKAGETYLEIIKNGIKDRVMPIVFENTNIILSEFELDPVLLGISHLVVDESMQVPLNFNLNSD